MVDNNEKLSNGLVMTQTNTITIPRFSKGSKDTVGILGSRYFKAF